jgi:hypothetical protein
LARVAERLNAEGHRPLKGPEQFHGDLVGRILRRRTPGWEAVGLRGRGQVQKDEWLVADLSAELGVSKNTLHAWMRRGWVQYRRLEGYRAPCLCWADASELRRLRRLHRTPRGWWDPPLPADLTTPRPRPGP